MTFPRRHWTGLAKAIHSAAPGAFEARLRGFFSPEQKDSLKNLAEAEWPAKYLTLSVAAGIEKALAAPNLAGAAADASAREVALRNRAALSERLGQFLNPPETWGDGLSVSLLDDLRAAGVEKAALVLADLHGDACPAGGRADAPRNWAISWVHTTPIIRFIRRAPIRIKPGRRRSSTKASTRPAA